MIQIPVSKLDFQGSRCKTKHLLLGNQRLEIAAPEN